MRLERLPFPPLPRAANYPSNTSSIHSAINSHRCAADRPPQQIIEKEASGEEIETYSITVHMSVLLLLLSRPLTTTSSKTHSLVNETFLMYLSSSGPVGVGDSSAQSGGGAVVGWPTPGSAADVAEVDTAEDTGKPGPGGGGNTSWK